MNYGNDFAPCGPYIGHSYKNKSNLNYYTVQFYDVIYKEIRF